METEGKNETEKEAAGKVENEVERDEEQSKMWGGGDEVTMKRKPTQQGRENQELK